MRLDNREQVSDGRDLTGIRSADLEVYYLFSVIFLLSVMSAMSVICSSITKSGLLLLVRTQFQDLFHSPSGVLLTFPSRYLFTIDRKIYLALGRGRPSFRQDFTCPVLLDNIYDKVAPLGIPGYHRLWPVFPDCSARLAISYFMPTLGSIG